MKKNVRGITLIALIITLVVLLILAGIGIQAITGTGLFEKTKQANQVQKESEMKEDLILAIHNLQIEKEGNAILNDITQKWLENELKGYNQISVTETQENNKKVKLKKNKITKEFLIDENLNIIDDKEDRSDIESNRNVALFDGNEYIKTNLQETEFMNSNEGFTIAIKVKISKTAQSQISYMSILGNHHDMEGFMMQFDKKTSNLVIGNPSGITLDYSPYYNNWTDIVVTYNNKNLNLYVNKKLLESKNITITPYENFLIGTDFTSENRIFNGMMASVKVWNRELSQQDIQSLDMLEEKTNVSKENIVLEANLNSKENIDHIGEIEGKKENLVFKDINYQMQYELVFNGSTYINTNIQQSDFIGDNKEYTIALRTNINRENQKKINYMDIIGNHSNEEGLVFQFDETTTNLCIGRGFTYYTVDYTQYYDKWTDIIVSYKDNRLKVYINGEYLGEIETSIKPYNNLLIGTAFLRADRAIIGQISSIKIWNKNLEADDIQNINMELEKTNIQKEYLFKEISLNCIENIEEVGTFVGDNYSFILK